MTGDRNDEIIRHFDVVAEGLRSEIRSVAEGHGILVDGQKFLRSASKVWIPVYRTWPLDLRALGMSSGLSGPRSRLSSLSSARW